VRIAYVAAGAGAMYCGACNRDVALFRALRELGEDLCVVPLYTPLLVEDGVPLEMGPLFMGGIRAYLAQAWGAFGKTLGGAVRPVLDSPGLLRAVSSMAIRTDPRELGALTVGVLQGVDGPHGAEMRRLVEYLRREFRPDIVALSFSLLSSLAPLVREELGVPVVCTLQGEEAFIEALPEEHRGEATRLVRRHAASIDRFVACAAERVPVLAELLAVEQSRIAVVPTGIEVGAYAGAAGNGTRRAGRIGYLSALRPEKGLDVLVEAFKQVAPVRGEVELALAGQILDQGYWRKVRREIRAARLCDRVTYVGALDFAGKVAFLRGCEVFAYPTRLHESRAVVVLEALAAGVPVVASARGVVPEVLEKTGGGVAVAAEDPGALAAAILRLLEQPEEAAAMGQRGAAGVAEHYSAAAMARPTVAAYAEVLAARQPAKEAVMTI
jgi:glycosyltransferase involved in cell wall biosynthesis